jgi:hypothetical protein
MPIIKLTTEDLRDPWESNLTNVRCDEAGECYGEACGRAHEEHGELVKLDPHSHLVISGQDPPASPRVYHIRR